MDTYVRLETSVINSVLNRRSELLEEYNGIREEFDKIVNKLAENWKGQGADAFRDDAESVRKHFVIVSDILKIMFDTLYDCRVLMAECDTGLGEFNRNPVING